MQTLEILIEENAFGAARPVEVAIDVPVATLISMLVEELHLPKTDLFGKKLFYKLRQMPDGRIIPEETTLRFFGISRGAKLVLDSYLLENSSLNLVSQAFDNVGTPIDLSLHSSSTLDDDNAISAITDASFSAREPKGGLQKASRRAFLFLGGAVLGVGIVGTGYAAYRTWGGSVLQTLQGRAPQATAVVQKAAPVKPTAPKTMAAALPNTATATFTFQQHTQIVRALAWSGSSNLLTSGADDQKILIWKADGTVQHTFQPGAPMSALTWATDGQRLAAGAGNQVIFYNAQTGRRLARGRQHAQMVTSLAWATHGQMQVVSCSQDMRAVVWDTGQYQARLTFMRHTSAIQSVTWAADGDTIASASDGGVIRVWSGNTGAEVHGYYFDGAVPIHTVAFAPTDARLVTGGDDGIIRLWNNGVQCQQQAAGEFGIQCMDKPQRLQVTKSPVRALSWSPDGRFLLSGSDDGTIALWYPGQKQIPLFTVKQNASAQALSWSSDGKKFASTSGTGVTLWLIA